MKKPWTLCVLATLFLSQTVYAKGHLEIFAEGGAVWQNRNDTQISPTSGTRFEIDRFDQGPFLHYRLESKYAFNKRHGIRMVYAPFSIKVQGPIQQTINFNGTPFSPGSDLTVNYRFNSYRLSYIYGFRGFDGDQLNLGVTAKIRDAETRLQQNGILSSYDNLGFVPLLYFEYQKALGSKWQFNFTVDAAVAPQGRAIDGAIKLRRQVGESTRLAAGIRSLEGGANNEKVFAFSWFNYAILEIHHRF